MGCEHLLVDGADGRRGEMEERCAHERRLKRAEFLRINRFAVAPALTGRGGRG